MTFRSPTDALCLTFQRTMNAHPAFTLRRRFAERDKDESTAFGMERMPSLREE